MTGSQFVCACGGDCGDLVGRDPLIRLVSDWPGDATTDPAVIEAWHDDYPDMRYAVRLDRLVVVSFRVWRNTNRFGLKDGNSLPPTASVEHRPHRSKDAERHLFYGLPETCGTVSCEVSIDGYLFRLRTGRDLWELGPTSTRIEPAPSVVIDALAKSISLNSDADDQIGLSR